MLNIIVFVSENKVQSGIFLRLNFWIYFSVKGGGGGGVVNAWYQTPQGYSVAMPGTSLYDILAENINSIKKIGQGTKITQGSA